MITSSWQLNRHASVQLTAKELYENAITWRDVFTDVPVKVSNSPLVTALMAQIDEQVGCHRQLCAPCSRSTCAEHPLHMRRYQTHANCALATDLNPLPVSCVVLLKDSKAALAVQQVQHGAQPLRAYKCG